LINQNQDEIDNLKVSIISLEDKSTIKVELDEEDLVLNMYRLNYKRDAYNKEFKVCIDIFIYVLIIFY